MRTVLQILDDLVDIFEEPCGLLDRAKPAVRLRRLGRATPGGYRPDPVRDDRLAAALRTVEADEP